jgi:phosphoribosylformimino-5-aminoimidazole carboxamide ribotide isomerase
VEPVKTRIVPAIDLIGERCVRLERGVFGTEQTVGDDPVEVAVSFERQGFGRLHLVDLDGAKSGAPKHLHVLEQICRETSLAVDFSGGLRRAEDLDAALGAGASAVCIGSAAVKNRSECERWLGRFGGERIILGLDVLNGLVQVSGWQEATDLTLDTVVEWYLPLGLKRLMSTDISRDGMLEGPAYSLYESIRTKFPELSIVASGGVSSSRDVLELAERGAAEVIVGKALYAGLMSFEDVKELIW